MKFIEILEKFKSKGVLLGLVSECYIDVDERTIFYRPYYHYVKDGDIHSNDLGTFTSIEYAFLMLFDYANEILVDLGEKKVKFKILDISFNDFIRGEQVLIDKGTFNVESNFDVQKFNSKEDLINAKITYTFCGDNRYKKEVILMSEYDKNKMDDKEDIIYFKCLDFYHKNFLKKKS